MHVSMLINVSFLCPISFMSEHLLQHHKEVKQLPLPKSWGLFGTAWYSPDAFMFTPFGRRPYPGKLLSHYCTIEWLRVKGLVWQSWDWNLQCSDQ